MNVLLESDLRDEVNGLKLPVTIVHGVRDMLAPAQAAEWLAGQIAGSQLALMPGCAHAPFLSHPEVFLSKVRTFFR